MLPLLPPDRQGRYAIEGGRTFELLALTSDRSSGRSRNLPALTERNLSEASNFTRGLDSASSSVQIEEVEDVQIHTTSSGANRRVAIRNAQREVAMLSRRDNMTSIAISYINQTLQNNRSDNQNLARPIASGTEIDRSKTRMIDAFKKQRSKGTVAVKQNTDQVLAEYKSSKDTKRALKVVSASGAALMAPAVAGIATSLTIHAIPTIALTGAAAVAPIGAGVAAGVGGLTFVIVGSYAAYKVSQIPLEQRGGRSTFSLWLHEIGNCFTFSDEQVRNQVIHHKLCNWGACLFKCVDELMKADTTAPLKDQKANIDLALKTLEAVLSYAPDKDKVLLDDFTPEDGKQNTILNNSIKLRYAFLKLIQEGEVLFISKYKTEASKTNLEETVPENYSFKLPEKDRQTINAARDAFICIIISTMESLKIEKEKLLREEGRSPNQYFEGASASGVINGEYTQIN